MPHFNDKLISTTLAIQIALVVGLAITWWQTSASPESHAIDNTVSEALARLEARLDALETAPAPTEHRVDTTDSNPPPSPSEAMSFLEQRITKLEHRLNKDLTPPSAGALLTNAIARSDRVGVNRALQMGANLSTAGSDGETPLVAAARSGSLAITRTLLAAGARIDQPGEKGRTALIAAVAAGHEEIMKELLNRGARVDLPDQTGETAMVWAAWEGNVACLKRLIAAGANPNEVANGNPVIFYAITRGHIDAVRYFLSIGTNIQCEDAQGHTPIAEAMERGFTDLANLLQSCGAKTP